MTQVDIEETANRIVDHVERETGQVLSIEATAEIFRLVDKLAETRFNDGVDTARFMATRNH